MPARPTDVGEARCAMGEKLRTWRLPEQVRQDAILILSELVTNAIRHTPSTRILCCVGLTTDGVLHLEVHDQDLTARNLPPRDPGLDDEGGRGLLLVQHFADKWGAERSSLTGGNTVWAALTCRTGDAHSE
ncbi:ATP-binding protein [Streptomyces sp. HC44]|uniref:ATP-binding protein n=1 Tax=Streptomyces scabichelini TaxID=2711217 RepID=A0A6G4V238_9ACTN|nr:ATP-binding protein [Streptomyces scabichelini]